MFWRGVVWRESPFKFNTISATRFDQFRKYWQPGLDIKTVRRDVLPLYFLKTRNFERGSMFLLWNYQLFSVVDVLCGFPCIVKGAFISLSRFGSQTNEMFYRRRVTNSCILIGLLLLCVVGSEAYFGAQSLTESNDDKNCFCEVKGASPSTLWTYWKLINVLFCYSWRDLLTIAVALLTRLITSTTIKSIRDCEVCWSRTTFASTR